MAMLRIFWILLLIWILEVFGGDRMVDAVTILSLGARHRSNFLKIRNECVFIWPLSIVATIGHCYECHECLMLVTPIIMIPSTTESPHSPF